MDYSPRKLSIKAQLTVQYKVFSYEFVDEYVILNHAKREIKKYKMYKH